MPTRNVRRSLTRYKRAWLRQHARSERALRRALRSVFTTEAASIAEQVRDGVTTAGLLFQPVTFTDALRAAAEPQLIRAAATGAVLENTLLAPATKALRRRRTKAVLASIIPRGAVAGEILDDFELSPEVLAGIKRAVREALDADYWADTAASVRDQLAEALQAGLESGEHFRDLADTIGELVGGDAASVLRIATTETTGALNGGHWAARGELISEGLVTGSEWLTSGDGLVREDHSDANGQVAGPDGLFEVGGESCRYPGDPQLSAAQRVNCRCLTIASGVWTDTETESE